MLPTRGYRSLSGSFRVDGKELAAICALRSRRMSMNWIAEALHRSRATVHRYVGAMNVDNRRNKPISRGKGRRTFQERLPLIRLKLRMYFKGFFQSIAEALDCKHVPVRCLSLASENSEAQNGDEPP